MDMNANRTLVMGIVNVTPDSFSDGGDHATTEQAIDHAMKLVAEGADILDVGGESTRPGSERPPLEEELRRVVPVVEALSAAGVVVSVDTMRAEVARATAQAGAAIINDVSGGLADPAMIPTMAELDLPYVIMHWREHGSVMQSADHLHYENVVADVIGETMRQVDAALAAGVKERNIILDPGIGFSKTAEHNWELLRHIDQWDRLGYPLLIGVSRKRFLGQLLAEGLVDRPAKERDDATEAITVAMAQQRVWAVRTHSVRQHRDAIAVVEALRG